MRKNIIPIAFTFDNNWAKGPACVAITSLLENAKPSTSYEINIISEKMTKKNKNLLKKQVEHYKNHKITFIEKKDKKLYIGNNNKDNFSQDIYTRLFIPIYLKNTPKIIYADADMIFTDDLSDAFNQDLKKYYLAAVKDVYVNESIKNGKYDKRIGKKFFNKYFNSGFLIMNLDLMRKNNMVEKFIEEAKNKYELGDQDTLNKCCIGKVKFLPFSYNTYYHFVKKPNKAKEFSLLGKKELILNPKVIHYVGSDKPWKMKKFYDKSNRIWWKYAKKSFAKVKQNKKYILSNIKKIIYNVNSKNGKIKVKIFKIPVFIKKVK